MALRAAPPALDIGEVHRTKGKICVYTLELEGDQDNEKYFWCGYSQDLERRILQHCGKAPGGAKWTALHRPKKLLQVTEQHSVSEALAMETAQWNLLAAIHGPDVVRGGRYNLCEPLRYPPRGWRENIDTKETCPREFTSVATKSMDNGAPPRTEQTEPQDL